MSTDRLRHESRNLEAKVSALEAMAEINAANIEKLGSFLRESNGQINEQIERLATQTHRDISRLAQRFNLLQRPNWQAASVIVLVIGGLAGTLLLPIRQDQAHQDERMNSLASTLSANADRQHRDREELATTSARMQGIGSHFRWAAEVNSLRAYRAEVLLQMLWNKTNPDAPMPAPAADVWGPGAVSQNGARE